MSHPKHIMTHFYNAIRDDDMELATKIRDTFPCELKFEIKTGGRGSSVKIYVFFEENQFQVKITHHLRMKTIIEEFKTVETLIDYLMDEFPKYQKKSKCKVFWYQQIYEQLHDQEDEFPLNENPEEFTWFPMGFFNSQQIQNLLPIILTTYGNALSQMKYWFWQHEDTFQLEFAPDLYFQIQFNPLKKKYEYLIVCYALLKSYFIIGVADKSYWSKVDFKKFGSPKWHRIDEQGLWEVKGVENKVDQDFVFGLLKK
eukprot:NODE_344_length_9080_cov_0.340051.p4 type:complete len:256 gc:universal NODE_344_length_9080_cov_0.340051:6492-5725(-)